MTVLKALDILETAVLECKKRNVNTPEVKAALDLLQPHIKPDWLIPQFRRNALTECTENFVEREGQQQVLRATFPGIRELVARKMDALAREFHDTHNMKVKDEIKRLAKKYGKLKERGILG